MTSALAFRGHSICHLGQSRELMAIQIEHAESNTQLVAGHDRIDLLHLAPSIRKN